MINKVRTTSKLQTELISELELRGGVTHLGYDSSERIEEAKSLQRGHPELFVVDFDEITNARLGCGLKCQHLGFELRLITGQEKSK